MTRSDLLVRQWRRVHCGQVGLQPEPASAATEQLLKQSMPSRVVQSMMPAAATQIARALPRRTAARRTELSHVMLKASR